MASGPEIAIRALLKALGFQPEVFANGISGFITEVYRRLDDFDARMTRQELLMMRAIALLEEINNGRQHATGRLYLVSNGEDAAGTDGGRTSDGHDGDEGRSGNAAGAD